MGLLTGTAVATVPTGFYPEVRRLVVWASAERLGCLDFLDRGSQIVPGAQNTEVPSIKVGRAPLGSCQAPKTRRCHPSKWAGRRVQIVERH